MIRQTTTPRAVAPDDVLRNPGGWAEINKTEAARTWRRTPVVIVIGPPGREIARWYNGVSSAPGDPSGAGVVVKYYRYAGPLPILAEAKSWGAPPIENLDTKGGAGEDGEAARAGKGISEQEEKHWIEFALVYDDGTPVADEPYHVELPDGSVSDRKLDGSGKVRFDDTVKGMAKIQFPDLHKAKGGGGGGGGPKPKPKPVPPPPPPPKPTADKELKLIDVSAQFAPGVENLDIKYTIKGLDGQDVTLKIISDKYPGNTLFERKLTAAEKTAGEHTVTWDGKPGTGPLSGKFADPVFGPYKVSLDAGAPLRDEKPFKIEIKQITLTVDAPNDRLIMNDPNAKIAVTATVQLKKKDGTGAVTPVAIDVTFTFTDAPPANTAQASSFKYATGPDKFLGKSGDATAIHWEADPGFTAGSIDGFKKHCKGQVATTGANQGKTKVFFKPSGVGGDSFKLKGAVLNADGSAELASGQSNALVVWRRINFSGAHEAVGQTPVTTHGTEAKMAKYYTAATFVEYKRGAIKAIAAKYSVKYIGLWDHANDKQSDWATMKAKIAAETPTADEKTKANGPAGAAQTAARAAITAKAQAWADRISQFMFANVDLWASDAGIPNGVIIAVDSLHPKYASNAPNADGVTNEWAGMPWLRINNIYGESVPPDPKWKLMQGWNDPPTSRAYILGGLSAARAEVVIAHEVGHDSKQHFKRADFGGSLDHSAVAGLMDPSGSVSAFTAAEIKILRGQT